MSIELRIGNKYRVGRKIGSGSFGDIYLGTETNELETDRRRRWDERLDLVVYFCAREWTLFEARVLVMREMRAWKSGYYVALANV